MTELTTSEAAALLDLDERRIRKDVEYGVFGRMKSPPRFKLGDLVYLDVVAKCPLEIGAEDRKRLHGLIAGALPGKARDLTLGTYLVVKLAAAVHDVEVRVREFEQWKRKLVMREDILGGEPVFARSRLAVRQIGEMARRGASVDETVSDHPNVSKQDVELARRFVAAYPRVGRPRAES